MKRATVSDDAGTEVGCSLVLEARSLVGPGVPRAPRIATPAAPVGAHLRLRLRGLHASVSDEGDVSWKCCATGPEVTYEHRTMAATSRGLLELADWLAAHGCTHVAMEATGVYWKPVWHVLEAGFTLVLANAMHIRNVPGRKSDMNDATWIADLLAHGLIRGSFVPPAPIQELRDLTRTRKQLVGEIARHTLRIQKRSRTPI